MFSNVGEKIKVLSKIILVLVIVAGVVLFVTSFGDYTQYADMMEYATVYGGASLPKLEAFANIAYFARLKMIISAVIIVLSPLVVWPLYGFGIIVDKLEYMDMKKEA